MAIIQKRADELKPGDVVTLGVNGKCSLLYFEKVANEATVRMEFGMHSGRGLVTLQIDPTHDTIFKVESPALSAAQQHAEELAKYARIMFDFIESPATAFYREYREAVTALLAAVEPSEPPTLEEALLAISDYMGEPDTFDSVGVMRAKDKRIRDLLDRARRANLI